MKIIKVSPDGILLEQYHNRYIRFLSGKTLLQRKVTDREFNEIKTGKTSILNVLNACHGSLAIEELEDDLIKDYLRAVGKDSEEKLDGIIRSLRVDPELFSEFYTYVLREALPENGITVEDFDAAYLMKECSLSPLDAYRFLITLRKS